MSLTMAREEVAETVFDFFVVFRVFCWVDVVDSRRWQ